MKTALSIPDPVFRQAERTAKRLGVSRSELFTRAMREFLESEEAAHITQSYNQAFADADDDVDEFRRAAARAVH